MSLRTKLLTLATASLILLTVTRVFAPDIQALHDLLRQPVQTSNNSRWYTLGELGLQSYSELLKKGIEQLGQGSAANSGFALMPPCSDRAPVILTESRETLRGTESWEDGDGPDDTTIGYPTVVRNTNGLEPDGKFYLFYSTHEVYSGIGLARSIRIDSVFVKLRDESIWRTDSRVLRAPRRPYNTSHYSSPVVIWNPDEHLWFMYFHYYSNDWEQGMGHQKTALATTNDLSSGEWQPWTDDEGRLIATIPVTSSRWMNSQSTYHAIARLPNGLWLAFLRGVGGAYDPGTNEWKQDVAKLGFAVSRDGRHWAEIPGNPVIHHADGRGGRDGVYRPKLLGRLRDHLLLCWSESSYYDSDPELRCGLTQDLREINPITIHFDDMRLADGPVSVWNSPDRLVVFDGRFAHTYLLPKECGAESPVRLRK